MLGSIINSVRGILGMGSKENPEDNNNTNFSYIHRFVEGVGNVSIYYKVEWDNKPQSGKYYFAGHIHTIHEPGCYSKHRNQFLSYKRYEKSPFVLEVKGNTRYERESQLVNYIMEHGTKYTEKEDFEVVLPENYPEL